MVSLWKFTTAFGAEETTFNRSGASPSALVVEKGI